MSMHTLGIIAPHPPILVDEVGGERAKVTSASVEAMRTAASLLDRFDPDAIVVSSPHAPIARDAFLVDTSERLSGDLGRFGAPQVRLSPEGHPALARRILEVAEAAGVPAADRVRHDLEPGVLDHAVLVPMSFLDREGRRPLVVLSLSMLPMGSHEAMGRAVADAAAAEGLRVAYLASGDLSHRLTPDAPAGYDPRGSEFDERLVDLIDAGDFAGLSELPGDLVRAAGECGLRSFVMLGGFLGSSGRRSELATKVLAYEGPWGVGYLTALAADRDALADVVPTDTTPDVPAETDQRATPDAGEKGGRPGEDESGPVALARHAIEEYVRRGRVVEPPATEGLLASDAAAFVSLHRGGDLRGCIGTITPARDTLAEEIVANAIQAATQDPRFPPLTGSELDDLEISVDVLHPAEPVDDPTLLDPREYGVIVSKDWRRGILLPALDGVDTAEMQVEIARRKAGIGPDERVRLERFQVDRYH